LGLEISCRNPVFRVDFAKWVIGDLCEKGLDNIIKYLKIPWVKDDPCRIAMTKKYRHMGAK
tara:strand:- start:3135 stop:3317 length:183 start_codon:yes stop_codon:yes gene_type:complete